MSGNGTILLSRSRKERLTMAPKKKQVPAASAAGASVKNSAKAKPKPKPKMTPKALAGPLMKFLVPSSSPEVKGSEVEQEPRCTRFHRADTRVILAED